MHRRRDKADESLVFSTAFSFGGLVASLSSQNPLGTRILIMNSNGNH